MWLSTTFVEENKDYLCCNNHSKCGFLQQMSVQLYTVKVVITTQNVAFYNKCHRGT